MEASLIRDDTGRRDITAVDHAKLLSSFEAHLEALPLAAEEL